MSARLFAVTAALAAADLVLPRTCPGCHAPGSWCAACARTIGGRPRSIALPDGMLTAARRGGIPLPPVHALARYTGPVRAAIIAGKERGRRDLPPHLGRALGRGVAALQDVGVLPPDVWLVPAPSRRAAARARGGDPVTAMARGAARWLAGAGRAAGVAPWLISGRGVHDSVGLGAEERAANLSGRIRMVPRAAPPPGASLVLLDDVLTTGATVAGSLTVLHCVGATVVGVLVAASAVPLRPSQLPHRAR